MRILAVDFGDARTGIAVSDPAGFLASPVCVLREWNFEIVVKKTASLAEQYGAAEIVVGYPRNMNGTKGERAQKSELFAQKLREETGKTVTLWDERCTTVSASVYMNATGTHGKKRHDVIDAAAASIILQDYLDYRKNKARTD